MRQKEGLESFEVCVTSFMQDLWKMEDAILKKLIRKHKIHPWNTVNVGLYIHTHTLKELASVIL